MTKTFKTTAAILAMAGSSVFLPSAAQAVLAYSDGDLILGFRASGGQGSSTAYLINLGSAASFINSTSPVQFTLGAVGTDLSSLYGSNWFGRGDLLWSLSGVQKIAGNGFANNTMFATRSDSIDGTPGSNTTTPWPAPSGFGAGTPAGKVQLVGQKYAVGTTGAVAGTDQIESTNVPFGLFQPNGQINSYTSFQPFGSNTTGASAYGYFVDANGIEGNFGNGSASSVLDLYQLTPGSGTGAFVGNVTINDAGNVTYLAAGVVPEPTVAASLIFGATVIGSLRRRRLAAKAN